jgi:hypothetical protein
MTSFKASLLKTTEYRKMSLWWIVKTLTVRGNLINSEGEDMKKKHNTEALVG